MIPYQFPDGVTIDVEGLVAIEDLQYIRPGMNSHSDYDYGEHYYELVFKFTSQKVRRYALYSHKELLEKERNQLIEDWKNGISKCLVEHK